MTSSVACDLIKNNKSRTNLLQKLKQTGEDGASEEIFSRLISLMASWNTFDIKLKRLFWELLSTIGEIYAQSSNHWLFSVWCKEFPEQKKQITENPFDCPWAIMQEEK